MVNHSLEQAMVASARDASFTRRRYDQSAP